MKRNQKTRSGWRSVVVATLVLVAGQAAYAQQTIYVNGETGNNAWNGLCETWDGAVCGPKETIEAGMAVANNGDTVIIAPWTYTGEGNRDLDFAGKAITVRSTDPEDPDVVAATVIDCEGSELDRHRAFSFISSEGPDSVLSGVTVVNGCSPLVEEDTYLWPLGGAILCYPASPTIEHCVLSGNLAAAGGAIFSSGESPIIVDCTFFENECQLYTSPYG